MTRARSRVRSRLLESGGIVLLADHPEWQPTLSRMVRDGELRSLLPGVVAAAEDDRLSTRVLAVARRYPDAVMVGAVAARIGYWPDLRVDVVEVSRPHRTAARPGYRFVRRQLPGQLLTGSGGVTYTVPALTTVDLCAGPIGADAIDQALRRRAVTLAQLTEAFALTRRRRGNAERLRLLIDSRSEPWSAAERLAHQLLRSARITGWTANFPVRFGPRWYYLDIAFSARKLAVEVESVRFHSSPEQLHHDRLRQNLLAAAGWTILRVDWLMLTERPDATVRLIRAALG